MQLLMLETAGLLSVVLLVHHWYVLHIYSCSLTPNDRHLVACLYQECAEKASGYRPLLTICGRFFSLQGHVVQRTARADIDARVGLCAELHIPFVKSVHCAHAKP